MYFSLTRVRQCAFAVAAALMLAASLLISPAFAADIGDSCCADLEERVLPPVRQTPRGWALVHSGFIRGGLRPGLLLQEILELCDRLPMAALPHGGKGQRPGSFGSARVLGMILQEAS